MGAGCYYTHENGEVAYWISPDMSPDNENCEDDNDLLWDDLMDDVEDTMTTLGYQKNSRSEYQNGLAKVNFESTYYGEGLIIRLKERYEDQNIVNLFNANFTRMERRIAKSLNAFYPIRYATSGYTANTIPIGEFGKQKR